MSQLLRQTLGGFRLVREIGRGGMGIVFEAEDLSLDRRVALKVLHPGIVKDAKASRRFRREADSLAKLRHPSIVSIHSIGQDGEFHFIVLEYVAGRTLQSILDDIRRTPTLNVSAEEVQRLIEREEPEATDEPESDAEPAAANETLVLRREDLFDAKRVPPRAPVASRAREAPGRPVIAVFVEMVERIARALDYAHREGIIHRDVKPGNILVDRTGHPYLMDFGLALEAGGDAITKTGELIGTPAYMSPEQLVSRRFPVDRRTDVYSLGILLYEVLTGVPPFRGRTSQEVIRSVLMSSPDRPRRRNPNLSADLETIVLKAMDKDPDQRYATAGDLADDLSRFLRYEPIMARPATLAQRIRRFARHHREVTGAVAAGVIALAGAGAFLVKAKIDFDREIREKDAENARQRAERVAAETDAGIDLMKEAVALIAATGEERRAAERLAADEESLRAHLSLAKLEEKALAAVDAARERFQLALAMGPNDARASQGLADLCQAVCAHYESVWEFDKSELLIPDVRRHDVAGKHAEWLEGQASFSIVTEPPGARVTVQRILRLADSVLVPGGESRTLDANGQDVIRFPFGDYLAVIRMEGHVETRYPFRLARQDDHRARVRLYEEREVPAGFVPIPAGEILMGRAGSPTSPRRRVFVEDFFLSADEVTMAEYARFVGSLVSRDKKSVAPRRIPREPWFSYWEERPDGSLVPPIDTGRNPVYGISYADAEAYCEWLRQIGVPQARLPSEAEWEKAARGADDREFPWGSFFAPQFCKTLESDGLGAHLPARIRSFPTDRSPYGIYDMAGSVAEWTSTLFDAKGVYRVIRGSAWNGTVGSAATWWRGFSNVDNIADHLGLRVAVSPPFRPR